MEIWRWQPSWASHFSGLRGCGSLLLSRSLEFLSMWCLNGIHWEYIYIWIYWGSNPYRIESTSGWIWWFFSIATSTRNEEIYWEYVLIILFDFSWIGALRRKSKEAFAGWYQCWRLVHSEDCCHLTPGWRLLVVPLVRAYLWNPGSLRILQILPGGPRLALLVFYSVLVALQLRAGGGSRQILSGRAKVLVASEDQLQGSRWRWRGTLNSRMPPSQNLADFNIFHSNSRASELKSCAFRGCYGSQWPICFFTKALDVLFCNLHCD